jgi:hypothetical protein
MVEPEHEEAIDRLHDAVAALYHAVAELVGDWDGDLTDLAWPAEVDYDGLHEADERHDALGIAYPSSRTRGRGTASWSLARTKS